MEIDDRFRFLKRGARVIDLGAAPGGWSQVAAQRIGADEGKELVVGVDRLAISPVAGCRFLQCEFPSPGLQKRILVTLGARANAVISDMLENITGNRLVDHHRSISLCRMAEDFASGILAPGATFCCKLLRGGDGRDEKEMMADWRTRFDTVVRMKPRASRNDSVEIYLVASGFHAMPD